jgi:hypothetical protein
MIVDARRLVALTFLTLGCAAGGATAPSGGGGTAGASPGAGGAGASGGAGETAGAGDAKDASATVDANEAAAADVASSGPRSCSGLALCDDFEGAAVGGPPNAAKWVVGAPNVTGTGALVIDDSQHHSGARSVKVTGQGGYSNHIFLTNSDVIGTLGPVVWARFYVRLSDALGDGHVAFLAMTDGADGGKHLRMGGQSKILMWNRESDDATMPALSPAGIAQSEPLPTAQWLCVEFMVDGRAGLMQSWVDGIEIAGLHLDATPTPEIDEQWLRKTNWRPALTDFALGWEAYAGQAMTLWFDDVALDATRIGCL